jgi:molybdopterin synthase catalytic subunit
MIHTALLPTRLDPQHCLQPIYALGSGAVSSFTGHVRADFAQPLPTQGAHPEFRDSVTGLFLEHHPVMTARQLDALAHAAKKRWSLDAATAVHRIGHVAAGDAIVCIAAAASHRAHALDACAFMIDRLKTDIALWKQEIYASGATLWVGPRNSDQERSAAWTLGEN